jgi:hypothetical protein
VVASVLGRCYTAATRSGAAMSVIGLIFVAEPAPASGHRNQKPTLRAVDHGILHVTGHRCVHPSPQRCPS